MNQFLLGASLPYLVGVVLYLRHRRASLRLLTILPIAMAAGALWAVAPDIPRALGMHGLYGRLAADPRTNIFLFHYSIDRMESDSILYTAGFVIMVLSVVAAAWRELYLRERES
jgi:hypothetical protein